MGPELRVEVTLVQVSSIQEGASGCPEKGRSSSVSKKELHIIIMTDCLKNEEGRKHPDVLVLTK